MIERTGARVARLAWYVLVLLTLAIFGAGVPARYRQIQTVCLEAPCGEFQLRPAAVLALTQAGASLGLYAAYLSALTIVSVVAFLLVAAVIFYRQPSNLMALFVSATFVSLMPTYFYTTVSSLIHENPDWRVPVGIVQALGIGFSMLFGYIFPNGRFVPGWTRLLAVVAIATATAVAFSAPIRLFAPGSSTREWIVSVLLVGILASGVLAQIYRYRYVARPAERGQIKWVVYGLAAFLVEMVVVGGHLLIAVEVDTLGVSELLVQLIRGSVNVAFLLFLLLCFAVAMLRYRLFDIDRIINRTLVYGVLTTVLALVYWVCVVLFQQLFRFATGQETFLALTIATLAIAALFQPLRRRIQEAIDRQFYRSRYDAARVIAEVGAAAQDEVDLERLAAQLMAVVTQTMRPSHVDLWLVQPDRSRDARDSADTPAP